jgi:hypothetical protein
MVAKSKRGEFARWIAGYVLSRNLTAVATRDITQGCHAYRDSEAHVQRSVWGLLIDSGWVRPATNTRRNSQTMIPTQWEVNPAVHQGFQSRAKFERETRAAKKEALSRTVTSIREQRVEQ